VNETTAHFSDNANIYSEQSIGFSETFTEISDIQAYTYLLGDKGKYKKIAVDNFIVSDSRSDGIFYDDQKKVSFHLSVIEGRLENNFVLHKKV
jgi:hypothetical protein